MEKMDPKPRTETIWLVMLSWVFFASTLIEMILSFLLSQFAWEHQRQILDLNRYKQKGWPIPPELANLNKKKNWHRNPFDRFIDYINIGSFFTFALGVSFFVAFAIENRPIGTKEMAMPPRETRESKSKDGEERGIEASAFAPAPSRN